ncbi:hypothetical protein [Actinoplanes utahensis]|uniref:hypothetical protein n=1 Tax=Actinoplanes utahensis TaxID=1869 RepID=UPI001A4CEB19|nr:hypothetical protein [Actinoplanes utahensis]GIF32967.1 hypothetical protein Aut01nite_59530 [Actinoplanes utahensis]
MAMVAADPVATGVLWLAQDIRNDDWLVRERGWRVERWFVDGVAAVLAAPD